MKYNCRQKKNLTPMVTHIGQVLYFHYNKPTVSYVIIFSVYYRMGKYFCWWQVWIISSKSITRLRH